MQRRGESGGFRGERALLLSSGEEERAPLCQMRRCVLFLTNLADGHTKFARGVLAERPLPQPRESQADHLLTMLLACEFGVTCLTF